MKIFCLSLGMMCHAETFLMVYRFRMDRRLNRFGIRLEVLGNPFKKKIVIKYANLVERNLIPTLSYRVTRPWSLCLYFFKCCFLLDAVREKYSYISHATLHFICVWLRTSSTISSWLERITNSLVCCRIQQKIHETHKICSWLQRIRSLHEVLNYLL